MEGGLCYWTEKAKVMLSVLIKNRRIHVLFRILNSTITCETYGVKIQVESEERVSAQTRFRPHSGAREETQLCVWSNRQEQKSAVCNGLHRGEIIMSYHRLRMKEGEMSHWSKQEDKRPLEGKERVIQWLCFEAEFSASPTKSCHKENMF